MIQNAEFDGTIWDIFVEDEGQPYEAIRRALIQLLIASNYETDKRQSVSLIKHIECSCLAEHLTLQVLSECVLSLVFVCIALAALVDGVLCEKCRSYCSYIQIKFVIICYVEKIACFYRLFLIIAQFPTTISASGEVVSWQSRVSMKRNEGPATAPMRERERERERGRGREGERQREREREHLHSRISPSFLFDRGLRSERSLR